MQYKSILLLFTFCQISLTLVKSQCLDAAETDLEADFAALYLKEMKEYYPWCVTFNTTTPASEVALKYAGFAVTNGLAVGATLDEVNDIAEQLDTAFNCVFGSLNPCEYGAFIGISVARTLITQGDLNEDNVESLVASLIDATIEEYESPEYNDSDLALTNGATNFIVDIGALTNATFYIIANAFIDTLYDVTPEGGNVCI